MRNDEVIRERVLAELAWDARLSGAEVQVIVRDGVVSLGGVVSSYAEKAVAETLAAAADGAAEVVSAIIVHLPSSFVRSDAELRRAATVALEWNVHVPPNAVRVAVENGWVELRGEFERPHQRQAAEGAIAQLVGVRGILNRITIRTEGGNAPVPGAGSLPASVR